MWSNHDPLHGRQRFWLTVTEQRWMFFAQNCSNLLCSGQKVYLFCPEVFGVLPWADLDPLDLNRKEERKQESGGGRQRESEGERETERGLGVSKKEGFKLLRLLGLIGKMSDSPLNSNQENEGIPTGVEVSFDTRWTIVNVLDYRKRWTIVNDGLS